MLQITHKHRILIATSAIDFRKGIDGIVGLCKEQLSIDPFSGTIFIFRNRLKTSIRILAYDSKGFWLCTKRLSKGRLAWWPRNSSEAEMLTKDQLQCLLYNGDPRLPALDSNKDT